MQNTTLSKEKEIIKFNINDKAHVSEHKNIICTKYSVKDPESIDYKHDETKQRDFMDYRNSVRKHFMITKHIPNLKDYYVIDKATVKTEKKDNTEGTDRDDREGTSTMLAIDWMAEGDSYQGQTVTLLSYNMFFVPKEITREGSCNILTEHK